jgi:hypothetical protein
MKRLKFSLVILPSITICFTGSVCQWSRRWFMHWADRRIAPPPHGDPENRIFSGGKGYFESGRSLMRYRFRHSHGGTGCESTHKPFFTSRASLSNPSSTVSPGAYFQYHQHTIAGVRDTASLHGLLLT